MSESFLQDLLIFRTRDADLIKNFITDEKYDHQRRDIKIPDAIKISVSGDKDSRKRKVIENRE